MNVWQKINMDAVYTLQNIGWLNKGVATLIFYNLLVIYFVGFFVIIIVVVVLYKKKWSCFTRLMPCVCASALWKTRGAHWRNSMMVSHRRVITHRGKGFHSAWWWFWSRESVYVRVWVSLRRGFLWNRYPLFFWRFTLHFHPPVGQFVSHRGCASRSQTRVWCPPDNPPSMWEQPQILCNDVQWLSAAVAHFCRPHTELI